MEAQVKTITEQLADKTIQVEQLEKQIKDLQDEITKFQEEEKQHLEDKNLIENEKREKEHFRIQLEQVTRETSVEISRLKTSLKEIEEHAEYKFSVAKEEWEKIQSEIESKMDGQRRELQTARQDLSIRLESLQKLQIQCDEAKKKENEYETQIKEMSTKIKDFQRVSEDHSLEQKIEAKKRNNYVKELKAQLKKNTIRVSELEALLAQANDQVESLMGAMRGKVLSSSPPPLPGPTSASSTTSTSSTTTQSSGPTRSNGRSTPSQKSLPPPSGPSPRTRRRSFSRSDSQGSLNSGGSGSETNPDRPHVDPIVETEVSAALAKKLAELQDVNYSLKRQINGFKEKMDLMAEDVKQKKEMIVNLVLRIETGALTTAEMTTNQSKRSFESHNTTTQQELFKKMEIVFQETTLQNIHYRRNLESMGKEVQNLMAQVEELKKTKAELEIKLRSDAPPLPTVSSSRSSSSPSSSPPLSLVTINKQSDTTSRTKVEKNGSST